MTLAFSQSCENNKQAILDVLSTSFSKSQNVLEIGSGTGQHAVHFAEHLPHLTWHTSDQKEYVNDIQSRLMRSPLKNINPPLVLDVTQPWPVSSQVAIDAMFTANSLHIMSAQMVEAFFTGAGQHLTSQGHLCIYGPFNYQGKFTSASNARFEQWLKQRNPASGIKDFEWVETLANAEGLHLCADHQMPANNRLLHFKR